MPVREAIIITPRGTEIINLKMKGLTDKEVAFDLGIKETTVRTYITDLLDKNHCKNVTELCCKLLVQRTEAKKVLLF